MKRFLAAPLLALSLLPTASTADDQDVIDYRRHIMETLKAPDRGARYDHVGRDPGTTTPSPTWTSSPPPRRLR
jgi:hypothetical protein